MSHELSTAHAAEERDWAHGQLLERHGDSGGAPVPTFGGIIAPLGPPPERQIRRVFVAKFDPSASGPTGRFAASDPLAVDDLWDFTAPPQNWIGDAPAAPGQSPRTRHTDAHDTIAAGDLVIVFRGAVRGGPRTGRLDSGPHLVGAWWVTHVHRRRLARPTNRSVTDVWHAPLSRFASNEVDVKTIRTKHPELTHLPAFIDTRQQALLGTTPAEAAALTAACGLPGWVLTDPDPVVIAHRLGSVRTGMLPADRRHLYQSRAAYEFIHAVEVAASDRVQAELLDAGWSVISRERCPRWGADLDCWRTVAGRKQRRAVEVKGTSGTNWRTVTVQQSQYDRARGSAAAGDDEWWLAICTQVLEPAPPPMRQLPASWVATHWPANRVRVAAPARGRARAAAPVAAAG
ncbi:hypothetical protein [Blastococcus sp. SYSU DS0541]